MIVVSVFNTWHVQDIQLSSYTHLGVRNASTKTTSTELTTCSDITAIESHMIVAT